jgi:hypothetical protein
MRKLFSAILSAALIGSPISAIAFGQSDVPFNIAERGMSLVVSPEGCVVNVTTAQITAIAMTDRSSFVYTQVGNSVYIKPIQRQQFEGVVSMGDGSTTLRIWAGNKILRFKIRYASSGAKDINIVEGIRTEFAALPSKPKVAFRPPAPPIPAPSPQPIIPVTSAPTFVSEPVVSQSFPLLTPVSAPTPQATPESPPSEPKPLVAPKKIKKAKKVKRSIESANKTIALVTPPVKESKPQPTISPAPARALKVKHPAIALLKGLNAARLNKTIRYQSSDWRRVQDAIFMLRQGKSLDVAVMRSRVNKKLVEKLMKMGGADA